MTTSTTDGPPHDQPLLDAATCLDCGYPLRGLAQGRRCPECGREFDPADPDSFEGPIRAIRRMRRALQWAPIAVWAATIGTVLIGSYFLAAEFRFEIFGFLWRWPSLLFIGTLVLAALARGRARRALIGRAREPSPTSERLFRIGTALTCVIFLFLPGGVRQWTCPHGTGFGVGPIGVAHSTVGGPCRNTVSHDRAWHVRGPWYVWVELR